jgi:prolipoprotein diacylglyceryltransferase
VRKFSGEVFLGWVIGYGLLRSLIEVYRGDADRGWVGPLSTSQFIGLLSVVAGVALLLALLKKHRADPSSLRFWETPLQTAAPAAAPRAQRRRHKR